MTDRALEEIPELSEKVTAPLPPAKAGELNPGSQHDPILMQSRSKWAGL